MTFPQKPQVLPARPEFSSGPCQKHPGWSAEAVAARALLGRSHRAAEPLAQIREAIDRTAAILGVPEDYKVAIVPASDTGAVEMALWSLLGPRPVDALVWETFGKGWANDIAKQLKLDDVNVLAAPYGELPDLSAVRPEADVVFTWNGTTSGARITNTDWIAADRAGLTICDATSGAFAQDLDWSKLDYTTFSWQKVMGGEAGQGVIVLSPRAVARLENFTPPRPIPKIFNLVKNGKLNESIFRGATIITISMLTVADYLVGLDWAESIGGQPGIRDRADANFAALQAWVDQTGWIENMVADPAIRSNTSVCLTFADPAVAALDPSAQRAFVGRMVELLEAERAAFDIGGHRDAPPCLRIWCGATVETADIQALIPWLEWAFAAAKSEIAKAA